jgi:hypothetical protein
MFDEFTGKYFLADGDKRWQGTVLSISEEWARVRIFTKMEGEADWERAIPVQRLSKWLFFSTREELDSLSEETRQEHWKSTKAFWIA